MARHLIAMDDGSSPAIRGTIALLKRYGWTENEAAAAPARIAAILRHLAARLEAQAARGSAYFIGNSLTAVDIHWACFANLLDPLPPEVNPMPKMLRLLFERRDPVVVAAIDPILLRHRDLVYARHLALPLDF
jgi:glutathione S-transferase